MTEEDRAKETADRNEIDTQGYIRRTVWFRNYQWARMDRAAKKDGRSISGWLRAIVEKALRKS